MHLYFLFFSISTWNVQRDIRGLNIKGMQNRSEFSEIIISSYKKIVVLALISGNAQYYGYVAT